MFTNIPQYFMRECSTLLQARECERIVKLHGVMRATEFCPLPILVLDYHGRENLRYFLREEARNGRDVSPRAKLHLVSHLL